MEQEPVTMTQVKFKKSGMKSFGPRNAVRCEAGKVYDIPEEELLSRHRPENYERVDPDMPPEEDPETDEGGGDEGGTVLTSDGMESKKPETAAKGRANRGKGWKGK